MSTWYLQDFDLGTGKPKDRDHDPVELLAEAPPSGGYAPSPGSDLLDWTEWAACAAGEAPDLGSGVCRTTDPDLFFPEPSETEKAEKAKEICATCPVREACLEHALKVESTLTRTEIHGIFGGLDEGERHALREERSGRLEEDYCPNGHLWSPVNIYERSDGSRNCRACQREAKKRHYDKQRATKAA